MRADLQYKLVKRFPMLYRGVYKSIKISCMPWGFEIPDSWYDIVYMLSLSIEDELKSIMPWYKRIFWRQIIWLSDRWNLIVSKIYEPRNKNPLNNFIGSLYWYVDFFEVTQVKEKYACYDEETEVLTNNGWKRFRHLSKDDLIATLKGGGRN